uniref:Calmodulin-binding domain-containing protein n=1 Tax=Parascaris univalens TaxID=6257 RepID=A0A915C8U4_PARUN
MGSNYWRIGVTCERIAKLLIELTICSICPLPGVGTVEWPLLGLGERGQHTVHIPVAVLLCLPMFLRLYIVCRYLVLHSVHFQDPATKAMASLNQISVDFPFVVRSQLTERPLSIIVFSTVSFWLILAWMLTQCERYTHSDDAGSNRHIIDFVWFEIVTFFSIGYGDVQVETYCGRALAIITGIVGTLMSSLLIALVGRRMQLSLSERRVNQVIAESQLSIQYKHSAARVLQSTWRASKQRRLMSVEVGGAHRRAFLRFRAEQRNLLRAITGFRRARWKLRMRLEYEDDYIAFRRSYVETQDHLTAVRRTQQRLRTQLNLLALNVDKLSLMLTPQL